jgi:undecaprenyl-diphosphatase
LLVGMHRPAAATFSFLMAVVAVGGAALLEAKDLVLNKEPLHYAIGPLLLGVAISFVVGIAALRILLRVVAQAQLHWFAYYCLAAGIATLIWQFRR